MPSDDFIDLLKVLVRQPSVVGAEHSFFRVLQRELEERGAKITWYEGWLAVIIARIIMPPEDIPIGILTGLAGSIAFVFLMR
ncbi:hypothetical protein [Marinomonas primoryensis]|uniref:hypothetical protein n=1 Tax=Marinomonas primoryensis TaxID=178399 RepID=UPI0030D9D1C9